MYTIDARTGNVLRRFSSGGSTAFNNTNCERTTGFESSNKECTGTLTLGQIEYTVSIQDKDTGESLCTINYFEWTPNKKDNDLYSQYISTMDNKYVYSKYDGTVFALDHTQHRKIYPQRPVYTRKFSSPVVRVFDVARPYHDDSADPPLVILPQPHSNVENEVKDMWVNCTESGSWYAMSEFNYPAVTDGAFEAKCYSQGWNGGLGRWDGRLSFPSRHSLIGVHSLAYDVDRLPQQKYPTLPSPEGEQDGQIIIGDSERSTSPLTDHFERSWSWPAYLIPILISIVLMASPPAKEMVKDLMRKAQGNSPKLHAPNVQLPNSTRGTQREFDALHNDLDERHVHFAVSNVPDDTGLTIPLVPTEHELELEPPSMDGEGTQQNLMDPEISAPELSEGIPMAKSNGETQDSNDNTPKKKKAHRGTRGGKRRRKNTKNGSEDGDQDEIAKAVEQAKTLEATNGLRPDEVSVNDSGVTDPSGIIQLGKLTINTDRILGNGSGGTFVFEGKWKEREVAVKRMLPQYFGLAEQEVSLLQQSDLHPNVIRYFDDERDQNFLYIAVELCQASLWDLYRDGRGDEPLSDVQASLVTQINLDVPRALYQLAAGLNHLHSLRIIHRDIKPQNILIAYPQKNQKTGARLVISDFGLCKTLPDNVSTLIGTTGNAGTIGWKAPELILQPKENERNSSTIHSRESTTSTDAVAQGVKRAVDIFSLGCVFFYVLTNGSHPFDDDEGWMQIRELNIKKNKFNFSRLDCLGADIEEPIDLLHWMLAPSPESRPMAMQVMQHPFFWSSEKRLAFLCDVSDHWEREPREPPSWHLELLERHAGVIIADPAHPHRTPDFLCRLDKKFTETLGKQRKYTGDRLLDLLRALRNKKNHYEDMPQDVKAKVGSLPSGYLAYWTTRFPKLLIECYRCVMECGLQGEPRFRPYFKDTQQQ